MEIKETLEPNQQRYWRNIVTKCFKEGHEDDLLTIEDFLETALVKAYELGRAVEKDVQELKREFEK